MLTTVGIDIGSSTSHLTFSRLWLQREAQLLSSRFVIVRRQTLHRSPIILTPYVEHGQIDVQVLSAFITAAYDAANLRREDVDSGAVILTGVALDRSNSRAIAEMFSEEGGKFVCASAGHILEAILAAHGSGAVALSQTAHQTVLNIDVGGGTTKFALIADGRIEATMAIGVGARLIIFDAAGRVEHVEPHGRVVAQRVGVELVYGSPLDEEGRRCIADAMSSSIIAAAQGHIDSSTWQDLLLAGGIPSSAAVTAITFSGGVSEFIYGVAHEEFNDLAHELADALRARFNELPAPVVPSRERIRATVLGASQYTVQLTGNTVFISDTDLLPLHNVPVSRFQLGLGDDGSSSAIAAAITREVATLGLDEHTAAVGIAISGRLDPDYPSVRRLAEGLLAFHAGGVRPEAPMIVALRGDLASTLGRIMSEELSTKVPLVVLDGLELEALDYMDIGEVLRPSNVVPVVIKSLLFPKAVPETIGGGSDDG